MNVFRDLINLNDRSLHYQIDSDAFYVLRNVSHILEWYSLSVKDWPNAWDKLKYFSEAFAREKNRISYLMFTIARWFTNLLNMDLNILVSENNIFRLTCRFDAIELLWQ